MGMIMHSATYVGKREQKLKSAFNMDPANTLVISKGTDAIAERKFIDLEDTTSRGHGLHLSGKYFRCEMDVARKNTVGRGLYAFMPYNKSPKTPWTMVAMGMRQIRAFLIYFPKAQQCGARLMWSQSKDKPVKSVLITVSGKNMLKAADKTQDRGMFRASNMAAKIAITGKGETGADARRWQITVNSKGTPGGIKKRVEVNIKKKFPAWVVDAAKQGCMKVAYKSAYPPMSSEFFGVESMNKAIEMTGDLEIKYGSQAKCDGETDGNIKVDFKYKTRTHEPDVKKGLEGKWYYKKCMEAKNSPAWAGRAADSLPTTMECFYTAYDATVARDYFWDIQFLKVTDRAKEAIKDYELKFNWGPKMLRNLKFGGMMARLWKMGLIKYCVATTDSIHTMDNVTYPYQPSGCWTLMSGHCAENPAYAVFTKKDGSKLALFAHIGGHTIEISGDTAKINGAATPIPSSG